MSKNSFDESTFLTMLEQRRLLVGDIREQQELLQRVQQFLRQPTLSCYNCAMHEFSYRTKIPQYFTYNITENRSLWWSIPKAKSIIEQYRLSSIILSEKATWNILEDHDISIRHIDHIPENSLTEPGILAFTGDPTQPYILIDGNHRAARVLREQKPFSIYVLDEKLSKKSLLREQELIELITTIRALLYSSGQ